MIESELELGMGSEPMSSASLIARQEASLFPCAAPMYRTPMVVERAEGLTVYADGGKPYLDFFGGVLTVSLGHCHPVVNERVRTQIERLGHVSCLYVSENQVAYAESLAEIAPAGLTRSFFTNSGTEAIETAIMLARAATERYEIVALRYAYSGRTAMSSAITAHGTWRPAISATGGVVHAAAPYRYRAPIEFASEQDYEDYLVRDLEETIDTCTNGKPAAFIAETILGVGGFLVPPPGYFRRAAEIIRSRGGLFISDEVQTGFGRTGDRWFGIEHWGVAPDIMVMAKSIANGYPVGATIARDDIAAAWRHKTFSTYGGNPISMAAAQATLDVMREEDVPTRCAERGAQFRAGLDALAARYPWIGEVRGMGLMQSLELVESPESKTASPKLAAALLEATRVEGLLVGMGGLYGHVVRMGPPMLVSEAEMADGLEKLSRACAAVDGDR